MEMTTISRGRSAACAENAKKKSSNSVGQTFLSGLVRRPDKNVWPTRDLFIGASRSSSSIDRSLSHRLAATVWARHSCLASCAGQTRMSGLHVISSSQCLDLLLQLIAAFRIAEDGAFP